MDYKLIGKEADPRHQAAVASEVLQFYRHLPFNYRSSLAEHIESVRTCDVGKLYPPLHSLLQRRGLRVIEVGCGIGWLANAIASHYDCQVSAIDFNELAVTRAREVAAALGTSASFSVADLFTYLPSEPAELVISIGVLHHTHNCICALRRLFRDYVKPRGYVFIGLYHWYGRKPFLEYFRAMRAAGASEDALLAKFRALNPSLGDELHLRSWFRDQVLHPHETQHTLKQIYEVLNDCGATLISTSLNHFRPIRDLSRLFFEESKLEELAAARLRASQYFPGFFVFLARASANENV